MKHQYFECKQPCEKQSCHYCDGGLLFCTVCRQAEGDLAPECPGPPKENENGHSKKEVRRIPE